MSALLLVLWAVGVFGGGWVSGMLWDDGHGLLALGCFAFTAVVGGALLEVVQP